MAEKIAVWLLAVSVLVSGVHSAINISQNQKELTANLGDEVQLVCSSTVEAVGCTFRSPKNKPYNMLPGAQYEGGRIKQTAITPNDCAMTLSDVQEIDNGDWECTVTGKKDNGDYDSGTGHVHVTVAVPPSEVYLRANDQPISGAIQMNLNENLIMMVDCVAVDARPAVDFNWYIGETKLNGNIKTFEEEGVDGKKTYISTLEYAAAPKHDGQVLKCEALSLGYTVQQMADESNWAQAPLKLEFMPQPPKDGAKEVFYGLKEGAEGQARIKFRASPKPTEGKWIIGDTSVPIGAASVDEKFQSSAILDGDVNGEYQVELTIATVVPELTGKTYELQITNSVGSTSYQFELQLSEKPDTTEANTTVIGIIILVVIIILVGGIAIIARAKGMWCFAAKSGEPLEEEKEAFEDADAEKGKLAPSGDDQVKPTPDKKPVVTEETKPETEAADNKEEKKSNGAHTPV